MCACFAGRRMKLCLLAVLPISGRARARVGGLQDGPSCEDGGGVREREASAMMLVY